MPAYQPGYCCCGPPPPPPCTNTCVDFLAGIVEATINVADFAGGTLGIPPCTCDQLNGSFTLARIGSTCSLSYSGTMPSGAVSCASYTYTCGVTLVAGRFLISVGLTVSGAFGPSANFLWTITVPADCTASGDAYTLTETGGTHYPPFNGLNCSAFPATITITFA